MADDVVVDLAGAEDQASGLPLGVGVEPGIVQERLEAAEGEDPPGATSTAGGGGSPFGVEQDERAALRVQGLAPESVKVLRGGATG